MFKLIIVLFSLSLITNCSSGFMGGNQQTNMEKLDKVYGPCNNPHRQLSRIDKKICEEKVRAAGPDGEIGDSINLSDILDGFSSGERNIVYSGSAVNQFLWNASLAVLEDYPLQNVDSQGGFISTDWIMIKEIQNQRCLIKVNINSPELISNAVKTKFLCETRENQNWYKDNIEYINEEKNLTLKILEIANQLSKTQNLAS